MILDFIAAWLAPFVNFVSPRESISTELSRHDTICLPGTIPLLSLIFFRPSLCEFIALLFYDLADAF